MCYPQEAQENRKMTRIDWEKEKKRQLLKRNGHDPALRDLEGAHTCSDEGLPGDPRLATKRRRSIESERPFAGPPLGRDERMYLDYLKKCLQNGGVPALPSTAGLRYAVLEAGGPKEWVLSRWYAPD